MDVRVVVIHPEPLMAGAKYEVVSEFSPHSSNWPGAPDDDVVFGGDRRRAAQLEVTGLTPSTEVDVVAVVPPNLQARRSIREHSDSRADEDIAVSGGIAADEPFLGSFEYHRSGTDVVALKDLHARGRSGQDQGRKRTVPDAALSVRILTERLPHVRAEDVGADRRLCRVVRRKADGVAAVERAALDTQVPGDRQIDAGRISRCSIAEVEEVDILERNGSSAPHGRDNAMAVAVDAHAAGRAANQLIVPADREIGGQIARASLGWRGGEGDTHR